MSRGSQSIFLHSFSFSTGDLKKSVEESLADGRLTTDAQVLKDAGFKEHRRSSDEQGVYDLAKSCVSQMPKESLPGVEAIFYATCIPMNANIGKPEEFNTSKDVKPLMDFPASHLQADFGMDRAFVAGLSQQACCSLLFAIRSAHAMMSVDETITRSLCVTADRFPPSAIYEQAYNVISDGAAACLIDKEEKGYRFIGAHAITNGALAQASDDETVGTFFNYTHRLISETLEKTRLSLSDIKWIVPQNMNKKAWEILASVLDFDREHVVFPSMEQVAHMISGDNIVNLKTLDEAGVIKSGEKILMPMAGFGLNWQSIVVEKV